jgi:GNAT superfamily N-acetyltransferase
MWTRLATIADMDAIAAADRLVGVEVDRRALIAKAISDGTCFVAGRSAEAEGYLLLARRHFFSRDFLSLVVVYEAARRSGLASMLMAAAEAACEGEQLFTSTNESNRPMQALLAKRGYLAAGIVTHLDAGDPELIFVKYVR